MFNWFLGCDEENEFTCKNNECIPNQFRCDGQLDCADDSDEHNCRKLRFIQIQAMGRYVTFSSKSFYVISLISNMFVIVKHVMEKTILPVPTGIVSKHFGDVTENLIVVMVAMSWIVSKYKDRW